MSLVVFLEKMLKIQCMEKYFCTETEIFNFISEGIKELF